MIKRHRDQLWARLDELYANGSTFISWGEIYHWYDISRISKKPWRDMEDRWKELLEEKEEKYLSPQTAEVGGGVTLFYAQKPKPLSKLAS